MKFTWLLFDADNTLLDFTKASKDAFELVCKDFLIEYTPITFQTYQTLNHGVWKEFEQQQITAVELRTKRMSLFLNAIDKANIDPDIFSDRYMELVVAASEMYEGVKELLANLKKDYTLSIVTNGLKEAQRPRLKKLELMSYLDSVVVSDEIGVAKPAIEFFEYAYQSIPNPPPKAQLLMIGDSLNSDIKGGNNFGIATCWLSRGKKLKGEGIPDYTIRDVFELPSLLEAIGEGMNY